MTISNIPLWYVLAGQMMILLTVLVCFTLLLRRMRIYHVEKMQQVVDVMVDHQKINMMIAKNVATETAAEAKTVKDALTAQTEEVRKSVVDEAILVKEEVNKVGGDLGQSTAAINNKIDTIVTNGASVVADEVMNKKLDSLLTRSNEPIPVEVVNSPLIVVHDERKKR